MSVPLQHPLPFLGSNDAAEVAPLAAGVFRPMPLASIGALKSLTTAAMADVRTDARVNNKMALEIVFARECLRAARADTIEFVEIEFHFRVIWGRVW